MYKLLYILSALYSPLEQFIVSKALIFSGLSLINSLTFNVFFIFFIISFLLSLCNKVTNFTLTQYFIMRLFFLVTEVVLQNIKLKKQIYILQLFTTFLFILFANLVGLLPYSFSITSHFSVTFFISFSFWFFTLIIGIKKNG
jgi:F-type H+-transporting ATPase subunit a